MSENSSEEPEDLDKEITDNEQSNGILYWSKLRVNLAAQVHEIKYAQADFWDSLISLA